MGILVDTRGLSCPQPVMMTLKELTKIKSGELEILTDNDTSKENVIRAAQSQGWTVQGIEPDGREYRITIVRS